MSAFLNFKEVGCVLHLTFATASEAYKPRLLGDVVVYPETDVKANERGAYLVPGAAGLVEDAPKKAEAWAQGDLVRWDGNANKEHFAKTAKAAGIRSAGICAAASANTATKGSVIIMSKLED